MGYSPNVDSDQAHTGGYNFVPFGASTFTYNLNQIRSTDDGSVVVHLTVLTSNRDDIPVGDDFTFLLKYTDQTQKTYSDKELRQIICAVQNLNWNDKSVSVGAKYKELVAEGEGLADLELQVKCVRTETPSKDKDTKLPKYNADGSPKMVTRTVHLPV